MNENSTPTLPALSDETIARIEDAVFDEVGDERPAPTSAPSAGRRRRGWITALGVAAAFVGGILIAPPLLSAVSGGTAGDTSAQSVPAYDMAPVEGAAQPEIADGDMSGAARVADSAAAPSDERDIITTSQVTLRVADVSDAADAIGDLAAEHSGYVEATDIGSTLGATADISPEEPRQPGSGWVSIRVPSAELEEVVGALEGHGEILRSSIARQDVTSQTVDLQARVDASRASVKRLTELMGKSGSVGDLIAAESALSERQAQLESYEQQLKSLDDQVAMSTISIDLTEQTSATTADPAGFGDGLLAGWNGLIASLNALVVALGFLLPWLVIAGVAVLIVWLIRRRGRRVKSSNTAESA